MRLLLKIETQMNMHHEHAYVAKLKTCQQGNVSELIYILMYEYLFRSCSQSSRYCSRSTQPVFGEAQMHRIITPIKRLRRNNNTKATQAPSFAKRRFESKAQWTRHSAIARLVYKAGRPATTGPGRVSVHIVSLAPLVDRKGQRPFA